MLKTVIPEKPSVDPDPGCALCLKEPGQSRRVNRRPGAAGQDEETERDPAGSSGSIQDCVINQSLNWT